MSDLNPAVSPGINIGYAVASVAEWVRKITVRVNVRDGDRLVSQGSGVIWHPEGLIVTNAHVAGSHKHEVEFADGRRAVARMVARDPQRDLAALAFDMALLPAASVRS